MVNDKLRIRQRIKVVPNLSDGNSTLNAALLYHANSFDDIRWMERKIRIVTEVPVLTGKEVVRR